MRYRDPVLVTAPAEEPITLAEAKKHCKIDSDFTLEDSLVLGWITAAREYVESAVNRAIITSTWDQYLECFPCENEIRLPKGRLQSVSSVKYTDSGGMESTLPTSDYYVDTASEPGRIVLNYGKLWPVVNLRPAVPVAVRFVAGYADAAAVPLQLKQAMYLLIGWWNEQREAATIGTSTAVSTPIQFGVDSLVSNYRLFMY